MGMSQDALSRFPRQIHLVAFLVLIVRLSPRPVPVSDHGAQYRGGLFSARNRSAIGRSQTCGVVTNGLSFYSCR